jgi:CspA family cold shock protein
MKTIKLLTIASALFLFASCESKTDVVESGSYTGKIDKVEADEREIYVNAENGKRLELYFTDSTKLTKNGAEAQFSELAKDKTVEVEVKKVGNRLDPISVNIVE